MLNDIYPVSEEETAVAAPEAVQPETSDVMAKAAEIGPALAMAYIPSQTFELLYGTEEALMSGTLFKKLDLPFLGYKKEM